MLELFAVALTGFCCWWLIMDAGYGVRAFLDGASGESFGREVPELGFPVLEAIRSYFLTVYGNPAESFRGWMRLRWWLALLLLPGDVGIFIGVALDIRRLFMYGTLTLAVLMAAFTTITLFQWRQNGALGKSPATFRKDVLTRVTQSLGGPAVFFRKIHSFPAGRPPSYLDGTDIWWPLRLAFALMVPALVGFFWSWATGGASAGARIAAALILVVYLLAEFPLLYASWVSTQPWPGTTPLGSYYPIWVIQRDIRNIRQNKKPRKMVATGNNRARRHRFRHHIAATRIFNDR
jgi:hypothetical protein